MMGWNDGTWYGVMGGWMWLPGILMMALLILGTLALIRSLSTRSIAETATPLTVAARRLAHGEISTEEFDKIRATLAR